MIVLVGPGGNGGGGLACARLVAVAGADVRVALETDKSALAHVPTLQIDALGPSGVSVDAEAADVAAADLVVDALLGYSGRGAPIGRIGELIEASEGRRVLALDSPTGLELASARVSGSQVAAEATMTLALPEAGLRSPEPRHWSGVRCSPTFPFPRPSTSAWGWTTDHHSENRPWSRSRG